MQKLFPSARETLKLQKKQNLGQPNPISTEPQLITPTKPAQNIQQNEQQSEPKQQSNQLLSFIKQERQAAQQRLIQSIQDNNLYNILQINPSASKMQIKKAYHRLALQYHPDKVQYQDQQQQQFQQINRAYKTLADSFQKQVYDDFGDDGLEIIKQMRSDD